ncbi:hypothetical protein [Evansella cellulosilytica]|uniref:Uncharacterized protein n=1 Tax=Evansella cellulosilytica (strain ATCC 21833 / DSM 2522 / FERM P-1141 / JCM 9156 / N-4) TaxID=649639 RepID=E6TTC9_EVAC2|nr:hypothetical protein [Evansella cellulosilytica]ADU28469.1 hypothetical protein Bcell_0180 [Evansella cellulosilytica DSM 2522]
MIIKGLFRDINEFIQSYDMQDMEINDAGGEEHGDFFVIIDFQSLEAFKANREKLFNYLRNDITELYGSFIDGTFSVDFAMLDGNVVNPSHIREVIETQIPIQTSPCHGNKPMISGDIHIFFEEVCNGTFQINDDEYGEGYINLHIQVDSYDDFLLHENVFYTFLTNSLNKYNYKIAEISLSVGVLLVKGESVNETSYAMAINKNVYGIE